MTFSFYKVRLTLVLRQQLDLIEPFLAVPNAPSDAPLTKIVTR